MIDVPHAPRHRCLDLRERRVAVPGVEAHAARRVGAHQPLGVVDLGGDRDDERHLRRELRERLGVLGVGDEEVLIGVAAAGRAGEVRAVEVRADDPRSAR